MSILIVNLTAHQVAVIVDGEVAATFPASGRVARLREEVATLPPLMTDHGPVPFAAIRYVKDTEQLPDPQAGTMFLVSRVLAAAVGRPDLVFPSEEVRDAHGRILGCASLGRFVGDSSA